MQPCLLTILALYLQLIFISADKPQSPLHAPHQVNGRIKRIAVVGAGAGGASASYHLRKFSQTATGAEEVPIEITVFESNPYIGGRSTTVNALDDPRYPVELGAAIFVAVNHILVNASRDFGLSALSNVFECPEDSKYELGIWDGERFVYKAVTDDDDGDDKSTWRGWWDIAKLLWKYGLAPVRTRQATRTAIGEFLTFYDEPVFPFRSIQEAVQTTGLLEYTGKTGTEVLKKAGVGELFAREIIQASTRVNYASNLGAIHGLETLVCMAIEGAMAVEGGNWQVFDRMIEESADLVFLNTTVTDVVRTSSGRHSLRTDSEDVNQQVENDFDAVVMAAPIQFANLTFTPQLRNPPKAVPYNELYVTMVASPHRLSHEYFGLESAADVPSSVLSTLSQKLSEELSHQRGVDGVGPAGFWSISTLRVLHPSADGVFCGPTEHCTSVGETNNTLYLYKIFSPAPLTASFLSRLLGLPHEPLSEGEDDSLSSISKSDLPWYFEKHWYSYPHEIPRTQFERFELCTSKECDEDGVSESLYYLNGMESFISTMETSALSGMNVARLLVNSLQSRAREQA